jgi:isoprenylcysteine carboxyl methyltransferase (ICMT) family protein YpbQ
MYVALPLVAGLDMRFGWVRDLSVAWHVAGAVVLAVGLELTSWAMLANAYFSTAVRIQSERGHTVCSTGPYRFVRHPGYVGFILQSISIPFLLGSLWALIPGITATVLMIIAIQRTSGENAIWQNHRNAHRRLHIIRATYRCPVPKFSVLRGSAVIFPCSNETSTSRQSPIVRSARGLNHKNQPCLTAW